ncbi:unnamed protein product [Ophioblennius macclurei]
MSLAEQSQQFFPTSVQVTVHQARDLRAKGKNGSNDAYAIIQVAKDKFSTSVAEKTTAPVWKEEASFDLPLFHPGNVERCTLYVTVMHRAQVGLDKFLGQAVVNLLELHDSKPRKKLDWFKLVDKSGKQDKERGEVLLDIQFLRNNMSASMFDLSMEDKPRSRISKLKDKVRGKKKDGFSDSASAIVPPVSQVLTDSEGEADAKSLNLSVGGKKKSKLKTLFAPKSNLHRNISQSLSTLGTLPEKNSSLSGSRSSGLNIDSPEVKKKFKFLGHKRSGSSDSKSSHSPFSLLNRSKPKDGDQNSVCINGNHVVYAEENDPKSGSTLSLNSSGQGSAEDVRRHASDFSADSFQSAPLPSSRNEASDEALQEQQHHQEELERRQAEERRIAAARKQEEEEKYRAELERLREEEERRLQEEQERKRRFLEDEARRKEEEERRTLEAAEKQRLEEERRQAEERKHQEEASMSERLTSLFGMIRKKDEKKEEVQPEPKEEPQPTSEPSQTASLFSSNPFEDISLSSDSPFGVSDHQKPSLSQQTPSIFLNRNAKVSAVKPRLSQSSDSENSDSQTPTQLSPSPNASEPVFSSDPTEPPDTFLNLHSSLAPPNVSPSVSPRGSTENLSTVGSERSASSGESSPTMADQWRRSGPPPLYPIPEAQSGGEVKSSAFLETDGLQHEKKLSLPLPDYETLFPQKRHGVQGHTRWDHIIAEVNQRHRELPPELMGPEMSVDGPYERSISPVSPVPEERSTPSFYKTHSSDIKPISTKKMPAPAPPKPDRSPLADPGLSLIGSDPSAVSASEIPVARRALSPPLAPAHPPAPPPRTPSHASWETSASDDLNQAGLAVNKDPPTAKPRQRPSGLGPTPLQESSVISNTPTLPGLGESRENKTDGFVDFDPFPSVDLLSRDPWAPPKDDHKIADSLASSVQTEQKPEDRGMTTDDLDKIFNQDKPASFNGSDSMKGSPSSLKEDVSKQFSAAFQRKNSQKGRNSFKYSTHTDKTSASQQEAANREGATSPTAGTKSNSYEGRDLFGAPPLTVPSASDGFGSQEESLSGGKSLSQVNSQNSNGGLVLSGRRPHPVKPLNSVEHPFGNPAGRDTKGLDITAGRIKVGDSVESGPYTQLTQDELITLVVKQQTDLSIRDAKISELEEYIDNLLVRVIEEKPAILQSLKPPKHM